MQALNDGEIDVIVVTSRSNMAYRPILRHIFQFQGGDDDGKKRQETMTSKEEDDS